MKAKKQLLLVLFLLLSFIFLSCAKAEKEAGGTDKTGVESGNSQEEQKDSGEEKEALTESTIIEMPHILLEEIGERHTDANYHYLYSIESTKLHLKEEGEEFNALRKAFEDYNKEVEDLYQKDFAELVNITNTSEEAKRNVANYLGNTPEVKTNSDVIRADKSIVSILNSKSIDYTGSGSEYQHYSVNFDSKSGKRLAFSDVVKDRDSFFALAEKRAQESAGTAVEFPPALLQNIKEKGDALTWTVNAEGVSIYSDIDLTGRSLKSPKVLTVYFDEGENLFVEEYTKTEGDYVIPLFDNMYLDVDVDGSGKREPVYLKKQEEEGMFYLDISVVSGSRESGAVEGIDGTPYLLKKSGKYYIYLFKYEEDGITLLYRIDLSTMELKPEENWSVDLSAREYYFKNVGNIEYTHLLKENFTDAKGFCGAEDNGFLSTNTVEIDWLIDAEAYPKPDGNRYKISSNHVIQAIQDVPVQEVDVNGNVLKEGTIPTGSYLLLMYTDNSSYMDMRIIDEKYIDNVGNEDFSIFNLNDFSQFQYNGTCYRVPVERDTQNWTLYINGKDENELFRGMLYVG